MKEKRNLTSSAVAVVKNQSLPKNVKIFGGAYIRSLIECRVRRKEHKKILHVTTTELIEFEKAIMLKGGKMIIQGHNFFIEHSFFKHQNDFSTNI